MLLLVIVLLAVIMVQKSKNNQLKEIGEPTKQEELVQKIQRKLTVLKIEGEKIYGTIKFESTIKNLEYVITPEENKIELKKDKRELAIDYELQNKQEYEFKVKAKDSAEEIIKIVVDKDAVPKIEIKQDSYAHITTTGVTLERKITMDTTSGFRTMYSLNNGQNWQEYTGKITTNQSVNSVIGKKVPINEEDVIITLERYVKMPDLALDAIGIPAYDGNESTTEIIDKDEYIKIEPEMEGFKIQVLSNREHQIIFVKEDKSTQIRTVTNTGGAIIVPKEARYLKVVEENPLKDIREIKVIPSIQFDETKEDIGQTKITVGVKQNGYSGIVTYEYYLEGVLKASTTQNTYKYTGLIARRNYRIKVKATDKNGNTDDIEQVIQTKENNNSIVGIITSDEIDSSRSIIKDAGGINYGFEIIYLDKNELPSQVTYDSNTDTYTIKNSMEIGTATNSHMAVLKCDGNLKIDSGVTITTPTYEVTSTSGVTGNVTKQKGLFICCMGVLTNNGTISQTARGTYQAPSEEVYLWKNEDGSYEYVPIVGGNGGDRRSINNTYIHGKAGTSGSGRQTGGGGSGAAYDNHLNVIARSGAGSTGNAYSGGKGGGGCGDNRYGTQPYGKDANSDEGGQGGGYASGGAGNPGGRWGNKNNGANGETGTGGLLIMYANSFMNNGKIESEGKMGGTATYAPGGSSGGGSINIFYSSNLNLGETSVKGGKSTEAEKPEPWNKKVRLLGGAGGNGTVSYDKITLKK